MREFIDLIEQSLRLPSTLYHGTSRNGWESIKDNDVMLAMDNLDFIAFTADYNTAYRFARQTARAFGEKGDGVVIQFDGYKLMDAFNLEPSLGDGAIYSDNEWRVYQGEIPHILSYMIDFDDNSNRGDI